MHRGIDTGAVSRSWSVRVFLSSAKRRMVRIGSMKIDQLIRLEKNPVIDADRLIMLLKKNIIPPKSRNSVRNTYPSIE